MKNLLFQSPPNSRCTHVFVMYLFVIALWVLQYQCKGSLPNMSMTWHMCLADYPMADIHHVNDMAHVLQMFFSSDIPDVKFPYLTCQ